MRLYRLVRSTRNLVPSNERASKLSVLVRAFREFRGFRFGIYRESTERTEARTK